MPKAGRDTSSGTFGKGNMRFLTIASLLLASSVLHCSDYSITRAAQTGPEWQSTGAKIMIPLLKIDGKPWKDIFSEIERQAIKSDPAAKGIKITIPDEFKDAFALINKEELHVTLGPNIRIESIFIEIPPPGWIYFPVSEREVQVIPRSAIFDDSKTKK